MQNASSDSPMVASVTQVTATTTTMFLGSVDSGAVHQRRASIAGSPCPTSLPPAVHDITAKQVLQTRAEPLAIVVVTFPWRLSKQQAQPGLWHDAGVRLPFASPLPVEEEICATTFETLVHVDVHGVHALLIVIFLIICVAMTTEDVAWMVLCEAPALVQAVCLPGVVTTLIEVQHRGDEVPQPLPDGLRQAFVDGRQPEVSAVVLRVVRGTEPVRLCCCDQRLALARREAVLRQPDLVIVHLLRDDLQRLSVQQGRPLVPHLDFVHQVAARWRLGRTCNLLRTCF
mmetsp:Transcript_16597/g.44916  ORF Transcript_16597/g.44916 Transcript_16597/m.44916 type:complete len:286 (-) Transcript_16597:78-935(-)